MTHFRLIILFLLAATAFGCQRIDEIQDTDINSGDAEFAIPLGKARTSIKDLLENFDDSTTVEITPDGLIHLRYRGDVLTQRAAEFLKDAKDSIPGIIPLIDTLIGYPFSSPDQLDVDFATYKSGIIRFMAQSEDYVGTVDFTLWLLDTRKNGEIAKIQQQFQSPTTGLGGLFFSTNYLDVAGYNLAPSSDSLFFRYEAYTETGERLKLPIAAVISDSVDFSYIEGYLGNFRHKGKRDSVEIGFFENWTQGDVFFEDPSIDIFIEMAFGVPTRSSIDTFDILTADGLRIPLESTFITDTGIDFAYPTLDQVGETVTMLFSFNTENSNIEDVLGSRPIALDYKVDAIMNPDSADELRGFITDSSYYKIRVDVDLPFHCRASGFGVSDTFNIDFTGYEEVKEAEFKIVCDNEIPLDVEGQVYFLDENGVAIDSLFDEGVTRLVRSAEVDAEGNMTTPTQNIAFALFPGERFESLRKAHKIVVQGFFSTYHEGQQSIKALGDQEVEIRLGMKLKT